MITIVQRGETAPSRKIQCQNCGCIFRYQRNDIVVDRQGRNTITCPQCNNRIIVNSWWAGEEIND